MKPIKAKYFNFLVVVTVLLLSSCDKTITINSGDLQIEFNNQLYSRITSANQTTLSFNKLFQLSEFLETKDFKTNGFKLISSTSEPLNDKLGIGSKTIIRGMYEKDGICITKVVEVSVYDTIKNMAFYKVKYINCGSQDLLVKKWTNHAYYIENDKNDSVFWSFQGGTTAERKDWIRPVAAGYYDRNFMGMNQSDYGGGIPVSDIWRRDGGMAIGHTELSPKEISLPVYYSKYSNYVFIALENEYNHFLEFNIGDTLNTLGSFVSVHKGDCFTTLRKFSQVMQVKGIESVASEPSAFEPMWCGWGYGRKFTKEEIIGTLPKVKELGLKWAGIDDGFQIAEGDWRINTNQFKGGDRDMKQMVDAIHAHGLKAMLWWAPLAADPGSDILKKDPKVLLMNESGAPQYISWWDSWYLSPAYKGTISYTKETVDMFMGDWDFDGLKLDGQHLNAVPADYNYSRSIDYPEKSIDSLPRVFKTIFTTARQHKPDAVIELCPCGCCMSFYNMPYTNQFVAADPNSEWQIRNRCKTYKALMPQTAYFGDHAERSKTGDDYFATSIGVGAVVGTKFTWPKDNPASGEVNLLTPEKENTWKNWIGLYNRKMLSKGIYLGDLYDVGFDIPETHVIQCGDTLHYAFYAENWKGEVTLRGLENKKYKVVDYYNHLDLGIVEGQQAKLNVNFEKYMLIEVFPD